MAVTVTGRACSTQYNFGNTRNINIYIYHCGQMTSGVKIIKYIEKDKRDSSSLLNITKLCMKGY